MANRVQRPIQPMPDDIAELLEQRSLREAYDRRPDYQRNDYLAWISRAKRAETRQKRVNQMLDELEAGGVYMGMDHGPSNSRRIDLTKLKKPKHFEAMQWLNENASWLQANYPGKWVCIGATGVGAVGDCLKEATEKADALGLKDPIMHFVRTKELQGAVFVR